MCSMETIRKRWGKYAGPVFYFGCVPLRITIGLIIWFCSQLNKDAEISIASLLLIGSLFGLYRNIKCIHEKMWWSRWFEILICLSIIIYSSICIGLPDEVEIKWAAIIIWIDVICGILQSNKAQFK